MHHRLLALVLTVGAAACSSGSANETLGAAAPRENHPVGAGTGTSTSPTEPPGADPSSSGASAAGADGGADAGGAGGDGGTPVTTNAFTGAAAYAAQTGPSTIKGDHPNGGNPAKVDCLTSGCHGAGGDAPRFAAGGTVYTSAAATTPAAQVEVRLRDAAGKAVSAYTDANGNFFVRAADAAALAFPVKTGARNAATTNLMSASIANGACSSTACHGGATGVIHVP